VVCVGHTHHPYVLPVGDKLVINPGSVGQPRDGDPRAGYLLWDDEAWTFEHVRLEYDLERTVDRILDAGLPAYLAERLHWGE